MSDTVEVGNIRKSNWKKIFQKVFGERRKESTTTENISSAGHIPYYGTSLLGMARNRAECLVFGALALTLHISRFVGVAPLRLTRMSRGWRACVFKPYSLYSYVLLVALHIGATIAIVADFVVGMENSVRMTSSQNRVIWVIDVVIVMTIASVGVFGANSRMENFIDCINTIEKVRFKNSIKNRKVEGENKRYFFALFCVIVTSVQQMNDQYIYVMNVIEKNEPLTVVGLYSCYCIEVLMAILLEMQFFFAALLLNSTLKIVNDSLHDLIRTIDSQAFSNLQQFGGSDEDIAMSGTVSLVINTIRLQQSHLEATVSSKRTEQTILRLILSYEALFDVAYQLNESYGKILLLLVTRFFFNLIMTLYFFFAYVVIPKLIDKGVWFLPVYAVLHFIYLVMIVEVGHSMKVEMERIEMLASQLLRRVSSCDAIKIQLDRLYKQVTMNNFSYSPMRICTLSRPLITTMFGVVTTYLIIILQFLTLDKQL